MSSDIQEILDLKRFGTPGEFLCHRIKWTIDHTMESRENNQQNLHRIAGRRIALIDIGCDNDYYLTATDGRLVFRMFTDRAVRCVAHIEIIEKLSGTKLIDRSIYSGNGIDWDIDEIDGFSPTTDDYEVRAWFAVLKGVEVSPHPTSNMQERGLLSNVGALYGSLDDATPFSDVVLIAEGRRYYCHSIILAAQSTVFATMLAGDKFDDSKTRDLELNFIDSDTMNMVLEVIYTGKCRRFFNDGHPKYFRMAAKHFRIQSNPALLQMGRADGLWKNRLVSYFEKLFLDINMQTRFSDVILVAKSGDEERRFYCHCVILCAQSPVFSRMLTNQHFVEASSRIVEIEDLDGEAVDIVLEYIYKEKYRQSSDSSLILQVIYAAEKYDLRDLRDAASLNLLKNSFSDRDRIDHLRAAELLGMDWLKNVSILMLSANRNVASEGLWDKICNFWKKLRDFVFFSPTTDIDSIELKNALRHVSHESTRKLADFNSWLTQDDAPIAWYDPHLTSDYFQNASHVYSMIKGKW